MHPELDDFLNDAFQSIEPTSTTIGRVVVTPDFDSAANPEDRDKLADELAHLLRGQSPDPATLTSPDGVDVPIPNDYGLLAKYVRSVTLFSDPPAEGPWVEVAPPGNWI